MPRGDVFPNGALARGRREPHRQRHQRRDAAPRLRAGDLARMALPPHAARPCLHIFAPVAAVPTYRGALFPVVGPGATEELGHIPGAAVLGMRELAAGVRGVVLRARASDATRYIGLEVEAGATRLRIVLAGGARPLYLVADAGDDARRGDVAEGGLALALALAQQDDQQRNGHGAAEGTRRSEEEGDAAAGGGRDDGAGAVDPPSGDVGALANQQAEEAHGAAGEGLLGEDAADDPDARRGDLPAAHHDDAGELLPGGHEDGQQHGGVALDDHHQDYHEGEDQEHVADEGQEHEDDDGGEDEDAIEDAMFQLEEKYQIMEKRSGEVAGLYRRRGDVLLAAGDGRGWREAAEDLRHVDRLIAASTSSYDQMAEEATTLRLRLVHLGVAHPPSPPPDAARHPSTHAPDPQQQRRRRRR